MSVSDGSEDRATEDGGENVDEYDVETLIAEIEKERQMTAMLDQSIADLKETVLDLDEKYDRMEEEGGEWKTRFETQEETNQQLQRQIQELKEKIRQNKALKGKTDIEVGSKNVNDLSEAGMKALVRQMEKEKSSLEGQLRDFEWRLDQESKAFHKASESKRKYLTELNQASMMLSSYERMQKIESKDRTDRRRKKINASIRLPELKRREKQVLPRNRISK